MRFIAAVSHSVMWCPHVVPVVRAAATRGNPWGGYPPATARRRTLSGTPARTPPRAPHGRATACEDRGAVDVRWMKAFMAVASELSFGRAAQQLHLAQPAVTAQIHNLERYLGVKLFERNNRGVRLTDAGEAFLEPCRAALQAIDAAATQARNGGTGEYGTIKIGFNVAFSIDPLVPLTRAVRTSYPGLKLQIDVPRRNGEIVRMVERQELHLGLIGGSVTGEGLGSLPIGTARLCVVVPRDHRLADLPEVAIPMLTDEPLVLASVGPDTVRSVVEHAFEVA